MKIQTVEYTKTFNLGNYSNERIGIVVALEDGDNPINAFAEAKRQVEKSHHFFRDLPNYERAQEIVKDSLHRTGQQVKDAAEGIAAFEANYPEFISAFHPASRTLEQGLTEDDYKMD